MRFAEVEPFLEDFDGEGVRLWLLSVAEKVRLAVFGTVEDHLARRFGGAPPQGAALRAYSLALVGCAPDAEHAVAALTPMRLLWDQVPREACVEVLKARRVNWIGELAAGLAAQLDDNVWRHDWALVDAFVQAYDGRPPKAPGFTAGWIHHVRSEEDSALALRTSPYRKRLVQSIFEHDRMGQHLAYTFDGKGFNSALVALARSEPEIRQLLLWGCVDRLQRGGPAADMRPFVQLHDLLEITPPEIMVRAPDYLGLLGSPLGTAAAMAQKALRHADEAGLLEADTLIEAATIVLNRREKAIMRNQATWLRQAAKRQPKWAEDFLGLLEFQAAPEPQRAEAAPERLGVEAVPESLRAEAAPERLGVEAVPESLRVEAVPEAPGVEAVLESLRVEAVPVSVGAMPPPITSPAELAEEVAALIAGDWSVATSERVIAALIVLRGNDREAVGRAIGPVLRAFWPHLSAAEVPLNGALMAALMATGAATDLGSIGRHVAKMDNMLRLAGPLTSPLRMMEYRLAEIAVEVDRAPVPFLLSTPTQVTGHLDAAVAVRRLRLAEEQGWQPWRVDLAQAMFRIPRAVEPAVLAQAAKLRSPAGARFCEFLQNGHRDPLSLPVEQRFGEGGAGGWWPGRRPVRRKVVALEPGGPTDPFEEAVFTLTPPRTPQEPAWPEAGAWHPLWTSALPSHREVVAARALPMLASQADIDSGRDGALLLPLMAECQGPLGLAAALAVTYALSAREAADRVAAADALLGFGPALDGEAVGRELAQGCAAGALMLSRAVSALRQAADAGAVLTVWRICAGALPGVLSAANPKPGAAERLEVAARLEVAELLEIADRCARALGVRGPIPEVTQVAGRGGGRLAARARALEQTLRV